MSSGRLFPMLGPATEKALTPTVYLTGGMWTRFVRDDLADQWRWWTVQGNVEPVHVEPHKPEPQFYTRCVLEHGTSAMRPERRKCGWNGEADESVELTLSGRPEAYGSSRQEGGRPTRRALPKSSLLSTRLTTSVCCVADMTDICRSCLKVAIAKHADVVFWPCEHITRSQSMWMPTRDMNVCDLRAIYFR